MRAMAMGCRFGPRWGGRHWRTIAGWALWVGPPSGGNRRYTRAVTGASVGALSAAHWAAEQPSRAWRRVTWRNGSHRPWGAQFVAVRVTPVGMWRHTQRLSDVGL